MWLNNLSKKIHFRLTCITVLFTKETLDSHKVQGNGKLNAMLITLNSKSYASFIQEIKLPIEREIQNAIK